MRIVFIVDDNLIGNKKAIKEVLRDVIAWQERHGYPLTFFTEASIDLADDPELMELMVEANIVAVFIGIESPNEESLRETKKFQNVRAGGTLLEKVHRIQDAGHGGLVRDDRRASTTTTRRSSTPRSSSSSEARIAMLDDRHALADPQDAAATTGWPPRAGSTRRTPSTAPTSSRCRSAARSCATATSG